MEPIRLTCLIAPKYYGLHRALKEDRFDEYFLKGGRGSAKSSFVSIEIILGLLRHPEANAIVYRRVAATLRESVYEQLLWLLACWGWAPFSKPGFRPLRSPAAPPGKGYSFAVRMTRARANR